jgi:hypothetical protein
MKKFDSLALAVAPEGHEATPKEGLALPVEQYPTVEEHAENFGLNGRRKAFQKALVFAHAGYAQGQRVSADAFQAALDEALGLPLRSTRLPSSYPSWLR